MADEDKESKTEAPSQRKLDEARKEGDVAKSQDLAGFILLLGGVLTLSAAGGPMAQDTARTLTVFFEQAGTLPTDGRSLVAIFGALSLKIGMAMAGIFVALILAAMAGHFMQHGLVWAPKKLEPKLDKLDPIKGAGRLFGPEALQQLGKSILKLIVLGAVAGFGIWGALGQVEATALLDPTALGAVLSSMTFQMMGGLLIAAGAFGVFDYFLQRQSFMKRMRMSREDLKEEYKQTEGDPHVKARIKQIRAQRSRKRMMAQVPKASVVIMNPTYFAVALRYEPGETPAPVCVAKGVDAVALRIRAMAEDNNVPIIEDPPLARALHKSTELDEPIPAEHFQAVAKIIGYVMSLTRNRRRVNE